MKLSGANDLCLRVPALPFLYGKNDEAIGHYRRYEKKSLSALLRAAGFEIGHIRYQNVAGILPWLIIGRLFGRTLAVAPAEGRLFNKLIPFLKWLESVWSPPVGLSIVCQARLANAIRDKEERQ